METPSIKKEFEQCHLEMDLRKLQSGDYVSSSTIDCYRSFLAGRVSGISYCSVRDKARVDTKDAFPAYTHPPAPELKPLSLDEIHQRYKNLRVNEPPHYIDIYRDAEAALGILRGGL